jgi:hypothetical protein
VEKEKPVLCSVLRTASIGNRAGHLLLFPLFAIRSSATSAPLFAIATPLISKNCNTLLPIRYRYFCFISVADCINFRAISLVKDPQH